MIGLISVEFINKKAAQNVHNPLKYSFIFKFANTIYKK